jgi:hypothetical protein
MSDEHDSVRAKVSAIFKELAGDRERQLDGSILARKINDLLAAALSELHPIEIADQIAFHLVDWNSEAAFLVAVHLYPERFTPEEIRAGVNLFLVHVPAHVMEAARLGGYQVENIFIEGDDDSKSS